MFPFAEEVKMKLKSSFVTQYIEDVQFMVPVGEDSFQGFVRSNGTAGFVVDCLKKETTEEEIVDSMCREYDAPREEISSDVREILDVLRSIEALDE